MNIDNSKTIQTLVEDIYGLFSDAKATEVSPELSEQFGQRLSDTIKERLGTRERGNNLRLSNLGTPCNRKLWYSINTPEQAEPLSPPVRIKFLFGDILEELLLFLSELSGHKVEGRQDELDLHGVKGHRDAVIDGTVVDVKSASSRSFDKFNSHLSVDDDAFGYLTQLDTYLHASSDDEALRDINVGAFLVIDKTLGKICLDKQPKSSTNYEELVQSKRDMLAQPEPPERRYFPEPEGKSGNMKLGTACSYCPFKKTCWPEVRTFLYSKGPVHLVNVEREPDVIEVTE